MKTKPTNKLLALPIIATALFTGSSANAAVVFSANFDGTTVANIGGSEGFGAQLTATNLDAGTTIGTWTVNQAQPGALSKTVKMIQTDQGLNVTNKALRFGISFDGTVAVGSAALTANLTSAFPRLSSDPMALSEASRTKQITASSNFPQSDSPEGFVNHQKLKPSPTIQNLQTQP